MVRTVVPVRAASSSMVNSSTVTPVMPYSIDMTISTGASLTVRIKIRMEVTAMNLSDIAKLATKPVGALSSVMNTPNSSRPVSALLFPQHHRRACRQDPQDAVKGKVVLITGASSGIGEGTARQIGAAGGEVVLVARTLENLERVANDIRADGGTAHVYPAISTTSKPSPPWPTRCWRPRARRHPHQQRWPLHSPVTGTVLRPHATTSAPCS